MSLLNKIKCFFSRKKKEVKLQNKMEPQVSIFDNTNQNMPLTGYTSVCNFISFDPCEYEVTQYKAQRDEKLKNFKANKAKILKSKADKETEEKERQWIKDIIKIAKQPIPDGKKV